MELKMAREIIDTLAQGIHPVTREALPQDSPYNAAPVVRALFAVSQALHEREEPRLRRDAPPNAGKPWTVEEDGWLEAGFEGGQELKQMATELGRSRVAVEARLVKLGKLEARPGLGLRPAQQP